MTPHFLHYHRSLFCLFSGIHLSLARTSSRCITTMVRSAWEFFLPTGRQVRVFEPVGVLPCVDHQRFGGNFCPKLLF
jgi:hypothetical protein